MNVGLVSYNLAESIYEPVHPFVDPLGFSMYKFMSPVKTDSFTALFPIWVLFLLLLFIY